MAISKGYVSKPCSHTPLLMVLASQANILVDQICHARLIDFGLLAIVSDSTTSDPWTQGGTTRWMGPELFDPEIIDHRQTKYSDCYALGMVIYEVLSGLVPFFQYASSIISEKVLKGDRPERPQGVDGVCFAGGVWEMLERCWAPQPGNRPNVEGVFGCLEAVSRSWVPPPPRSISPVISSTADSPTQGFSGIFSTENADRSRVSSSSRSAPSQPLGELDLEGSTGIVGGVGWPSIPDEFLD